MEVVVVSDVHNEFRHSPPSPDHVILPTEGDKDRVLVVAGDLGEARKPETWQPYLEQWCDRFRHVIYVPGNHEFFGMDIKQAVFDQALFALDIDNLTYSGLIGDKVEIDGVRFVCTPLYSPMGSDVATKELIRTSIYDFSVITYEVFKLRPEDYENFHEMCMRHIDSSVKSDGLKNVIVTHWTPSHKSSAPRYRNSPINDYFSNHLDYYITEDWNPDVWIHGHTHDAYDYDLGGTRIVCNPYGYPHDFDNGYVPRKTLEI